MLVMSCPPVRVRIQSSFRNFKGSGMNIKRQVLLGAIFSAVICAGAWAQNYKMTTPIAPGVAVPDKIESSIGTLNLHYGYPDAETVEKIYDNLDRSRALQAYLMAIPIVNQAGMRDSIRKFGPDNQTDVHLGTSGRSRDRRTDGERQHHLQLHLGRHQEGAAGRGGSAQGARAGVNDFLVSLGRRRRHHRRRQGHRRQIPRAAARLQGRCPGRATTSCGRDVRQLAGLPGIPRRWLDQARCRDRSRRT